MNGSVPQLHEGDRSSPKLIFMHVPKSGGTSFRAVLTSVYGRDEVKFDGRGSKTASGTPFNRAVEHWHRQRSLGLEVPMTWPRVVTGHIPLEKYKVAFPDAFTVTWLREPVARIVSSYFYLRGPLPPHDRRVTEMRKAVHAGALSLEEFVERRHANSVSQRLLRGYTLGDLDFVGVTEHFASDLSELASTLAWPVVEVPLLLVNTLPEYRSFRLSASLRRRIERLNEEDIAIYREALERRRKRARTSSKW